MTRNQINYFLAVAKFLNFTQAASSLFVTQSTLSRSIAALENEIGVQLLERDFHNVRLTPAGVVMNNEMQSLMREIEAVIKRVQATANITSNKFAIGILSGQQIDNQILLTLRNLSDKYPKFSMDVKRMGYSDLIAELKANRLDIAETVVTETTVLDPEIECYSISTAKNYLIAHIDNKIWNERVSLKSVDGKTLVVAEEAHPGDDGLRRKIEEAGLHPIYRGAADMETHSLWLEAGMGVSILNENNIIYSSRAFRPLKTAHITELADVHIALIWNKNHPAPLVDEFITFIKSGLSRE